jgi:hypothetical protein
MGEKKEWGLEVNGRNVGSDMMCQMSGMRYEVLGITVQNYFQKVLSRD